MKRRLLLTTALAAPFLAKPAFANQAPTLQAMIDVGTTVPPGRYVVESQLVVRQGRHARGGGTTQRQTPYSPLRGGVILEVRWGQGAGYSGDITKAAIKVEQGATIESFAGDYPDQDPHYAAPLEWGSFVQIAGGYATSAHSIHVNKAYIGVDARGSRVGMGMAPYIANINGCPLKHGVALDFMVDWGHLADFRFNAGTIGYPLPGGWQSSALCRWVADNGNAVYLGGNDWATVDRLQCWGYRRGVLIESAAGYPATGPFTIANSQMDATLVGVDVWGEPPYQQRISVENNRFCPFHPFTDQPGYCFALNPGTSGKSWSFRGNYAFNRISAMVHAAGSTWQNQQMLDNEADSVTPGARVVWGNGPRQDSNNSLRGLL